MKKRADQMPTPQGAPTNRKKNALVAAKKTPAVKARPAVNLPATQYEPTPREEALMEQYLAGGQRRETPRITVEEKDGRIVVSNDHPMRAVGQLLLMEEFASTSSDFASAITNQLVDIGTQGKVLDSTRVNNALSLVKAIQPRDEVETMLATQMASVHLAAVAAGRRLAHADNLLQQDSASNAFNKLARTFAAQMEALKRYRSKGEQRVYVERVNVESGGQAIVGPVGQTGEG
jgi:hypothetical protein